MRTADRLPDVRGTGPALRTGCSLRPIPFNSEDTDERHIVGSRMLSRLGLDRSKQTSAPPSAASWAAQVAGHLCLLALRSAQPRPR